MKCRHVEKVLFGGYKDGELNNSYGAEISEHLKKCEKCRFLKTEIEKTSILPFANASQFTPPESVWLGIKASIQGQRRDCSVSFLVCLREFLSVRRPTFAAATAVTLLIAALFTGVQRNDQDRRVSDYIYEEMDFFFSLAGGNGYFDRDIGIPDENIFM